MRPQKPKTTGEGDLFRARLEQIINMKHELVQRPAVTPASASSAAISGLLVTGHELPHSGVPVG
jgi:hypothetical protein